MSIQAGIKLPDRDVQTWLRLTSKNLYTRRRQLDSKASIMLSVSAVLLMLCVGAHPVVRHDILMYAPLFPAGLCFMVSMFLAVRAMRPRTCGAGKPTEQEIRDGTAKLTTFEHFSGMSEAEYQAAVNLLLRDRSFLYDSLSRDIYEVGTMLAHRYRLLKRSYSLFLAGMGFTMLSFVAAQYRMFT